MEAVQDAHAEGSESDEENIRKDDAVERDGLVPTCDAVFGGRKSGDDMRREDDTEDRDHRENERQGPEEAVGKVPEFFAVTLAHVGGENGDERGGDGAFGDEATGQVGEAVGEDEGVGREGGAEKERNALVADIAENTTHNGH